MSRRFPRFSLVLRLFFKEKSEHMFRSRLRAFTEAAALRSIVLPYISKHPDSPNVFKKKIYSSLFLSCLEIDFTFSEFPHLPDGV